MAFDLPDGGGYRVGMAVFMIIGRPLRVLVVDADRRPVIGKFLDDPAVLRASGLDFKEVIRLSDEPEIRGSEKCAFPCSEHQHPSFRRLLRGRWDVSINCFFISVCLLYFSAAVFGSALWGSAMLNQVPQIIHSYLRHKMYKLSIRFLYSLCPLKNGPAASSHMPRALLSVFISGWRDPGKSIRFSFPGRISAAPTGMRLSHPPHL